MHHGRKSVLVLGALGVVYGDIGTSPLYTLRETIYGHGVTVGLENVLGVLSLVFWALFFVISVKYCALVLVASNQGEGGVFALVSLLRKAAPSRFSTSVAGLLLFGAALLYADGIITPAISVLSAVEGLEVVAPSLHAWILPVTTAIILVLFAIQHRGTQVIGRFFGPVMLVWFLTLIALGLPHIAEHPEVLRAINPYYAWMYFSAHSWEGFWVLGSIVLCVTGGEALYADMGHFGASPIRVGWFGLVYPALLVNYFGQGAMLLSPEFQQAVVGVASPNLFYLMAPEEYQLALLVVATAATIIASQALISGAYSLTAQAISLGVFPRLLTKHTSAEIAGQIYLPTVNLGLLVGTVSVVWYFQSASALAAAYGIAVTGTMALTTIGYFAVTRTWGWSVVGMSVVCGGLLLIDLAFLGANLAKFFDGGYVPVSIGVVLSVIMSTWAWGRSRIRTAEESADRVTVDDELARWEVEYIRHLPRVIVFLTSREVGTLSDHSPKALTAFRSYFHSYPRFCVFLSVRYENVPEVAGVGKIQVVRFNDNIASVVFRVGYMETVHLPTLLAMLGLDNAGIVTCEDHVVAEGAAWSNWRSVLFGWMLRAAVPAEQMMGLVDDARVIRVVSWYRFSEDGAVPLPSSQPTGITELMPGF